ncbi:MAG: ribonuclease PH [Pseudobdellovibrionaceae bacterium]|nr:ribonuclease PH [Bdellovibrionales bacterium]USN46152.1 MAG: ribonuclease PH [Pseudobdellovibrionaceae bacterium]
MRTDGRSPQEIRSLTITPEVIRNAEGSVQIDLGHTRLICTASVEANVPKWLSGSGQGWITAEYGMLPRSTHTRLQREKALTGGRTQEISRLIGRSLRAAVELAALGEKQIYVDCDVIQADGGTRTAAITGGFVALALALKFMHDQGQIKSIPLKSYVSAISVGLKGSDLLLDLNYDEDSSIDTDMNFVMTDSFHFIEIQGTAEGQPFDKDQLDAMADLARAGCQTLFAAQRELLGQFLLLGAQNS